MLKKERQKGSTGDRTQRSARGDRIANGHSHSADGDRNRARRRPNSEPEGMESRPEPQPLMEKDDRMKTKVCKS